MKNLFELLAGASRTALVIGLALLGFAAEAQTPVAPKFYPLTNTTGTLSITNGLSPITTTGVSNYNSVPFPIWRDRGFVFHIGTIGASGSATGAAVATLQLATPHTNYAGGLETNWDNSLTFSWTSTGTTEAFYSTNVPKAITDNYTIGRFASATNASTVTISIDPTNTFISATP